MTPFSRREFWYGASAVQAAAFAAQAASKLKVVNEQEISQRPETEPAPGFQERSTVAIARSENRRRSVHDALFAIDDQIQPILKTREYVILKPNGVNADQPFACTDIDALRGALDYLTPRFKGPVVIAESAAYRASWDSFDSLYYPRLIKEYKDQRIKLVDMNEEPGYQVMTILGPDLNPVPIRLAKRMVDDSAYVINLPKAKWHGLVVVTLAVKNMVMAAPLRSSRKEANRWTDKWKVHPTYRHAQYNMLLVAQQLRPYWGATVIDAWEGIEISNGRVDQRIAIASTDYVAADRVMIEAMQIDPGIIGYLVYCGQAGLGQYDLSKIDIRGEKIEDVKMAYALPKDLDRRLEWMQPMTDVPVPIRR